ncbi:centrosomal protein 57 like 1 [Turdus rufiventris]|nr:centrosomal protein 57 like 1 [Turdus rufiventris]
MSIDFYSNPIQYSGFYCWPYSEKVNRNGIKAMDSESKNSFIGSFLQPPDWMLPAAFVYKESKKFAAAAGDRPSLPNKQAVVAALKALQEKICRLELEKSQAEDKLCSLSRAAAQYRKVLEYESYEKDTAHRELMQQRKDASVQLNAAQSRCSLLEKQLDYMRKMVSSAEQEKKMILEQQAQLQKEEGQNRLELHAKLEKLEMFEKECLKLTAAQRIAELQTGFDINRISVSSVTSQHEPEKENGKNKKPRKRNPTMKKMQLLQLHVKAGELPFVAGKHQELLEQIQETQDSQAREDLQQELDCLVKQMEMKGKQISKLKKHQATVQKLKKKTQKLEQGATHVKLKCGEQKEARGNAVTVKEKSYHKDNGFTLSWHNTETKELKLQFQLLLSHFDIDYNLKNLNTH